MGAAEGSRAAAGGGCGRGLLRGLEGALRRGGERRAATAGASGAGFVAAAVWAAAVGAAGRLRAWDEAAAAEAGERTGVPLVGVVSGVEGPAAAVLFVGALLAGLAIVPLDPADPLPRRRARLRALAPARLVGVAASSAEEAREWGELAREAGVAGASGPAGAALADVVRELWNWDPGAPDVAAPPAPAGDPDARVSHVWFTSGSTGAPKPCVCSLGNLASYCSAKNARQGVGAGSVVLLASPLTFDPFLGDAVATLAAGAELVAPPRARVFAALGACLQEAGATHVQTTPALWGTLAACGYGPQEFPALRVVALGGEPIPPSMAAEWGAASGVELLNTYGVTECCMYQACRTVAGTADRRLLGPPFRGTGLLLREPRGTADGGGDADAEPGVVPEGSGELAELWLSGRQVGLGYLPEALGNGDATGKAAADRCSRFRCLRGHGWCFRTGDIVRCTPGGLEFVGRKDSQVKVRGQRVELAEVEEVLAGAAPELVRLSAAVLHGSGARDGVSGLLVAWCVPPSPSTGGDTTGGEGRGSAKAVPAGLRSRVLREALRVRLPGHMIPARFAFLPELPVTASGKVSRRELLRRGLPDAPEGVGIGSGGRLRGGWETLVAEEWTCVLGLPGAWREMGREADFAALGGHSLLALQVCQNLSRRIVREGVGAGRAGGEFGELLGALAPAELLARTRLKDFASHLRKALGDPPGESGEGSSGGEEDEAAEDWDVALRGGDASLLAEAAAAGCLGSVKVLLRQPPSEPCAAGPAGPAEPGVMAPLHCACAAGQTDVAAALLDAGAGVNMLGPGAAPPFLFAAQRGPVHLLRLLLSRGARPAARDDSGLTALHHACRAGAPLRVVSAVLEVLSPGRDLPASKARPKVGAPSDPLAIRDRWGRTPLHWAVVNGHSGIVKLLLELGASPAERDGAGETPLEIAERRAQCGAQERPNGARASTWGGIARVLGGAGTTERGRELRRERQALSAATT